jgi:hypothetical protein
MLTYKELSSEQKQFVDAALSGANILVDACIGSGKTTAIQVLCNELPATRKVLYMTYNKLLKLDAKAKIHNRNVYVTNYHGFGYAALAKVGVHVGITDIIQEYNRRKPTPEAYDLLILDEYQDIEEEVAEMLRHLKACNPKMQIVAVGDMAQKIYDKTRLNSAAFIGRFLGPHLRLEFTQCFRLCADWAEELASVWQKSIHGVNPSCEVSFMDFEGIFDFVKNCEPRQVLCLGSNIGKRNDLLNRLEKECGDKWNKWSVWAKISDADSNGATQPTADTAVFTTYDGCKGMERDICILFDWTKTYWASRMTKPDARYEIVRNIFCVAASRGKRRIIIAKAKDQLPFKTMKESEMYSAGFQDVAISSMFDYKFVEDVEDAYKRLSVREISPAAEAIDVPTRDAMIDLSPCIGIYQEAGYFNGYDIDKDIEMYFRMNKEKAFMRIPAYKTWPVEKKVLYLVSLETGQNRYWHQVKLPIVTQDEATAIAARLNTRLPADSDVQVHCSIPFFQKGQRAFAAEGFADAVKGGTVYELKFVSELSHPQFLQCACYMVALKLERGILWNVRTNQAYEIRIPDRDAFLDAVARAITKGKLGKGSASVEKKQKKTLKPQKKEAPGAKHQVQKFCKKNQEACMRIFNTIERQEARKGRPSSKELAMRFQSRRLSIPVPKDVFAKYFYDVMTDMKYGR